jgi:hypothetical protein
LHLLVNINDLRVIRAYLSDGTEFGYLIATGKWGIIPHSLRMRKQINQLIHRKVLFISQMDDPVECLQRYLEEEAEKKKKPRNQLENLRRYQQLNGKEPNIQNNKNQSTLPQHEKLPSTKEQDTKKNELNSLRQRFRTITF